MEHTAPKGSSPRLNNWCVMKLRILAHALAHQMRGLHIVSSFLRFTTSVLLFLGVASVRSDGPCAYMQIYVQHPPSLPPSFFLSSSLFLSYFAFEKFVK